MKNIFLYTLVLLAAYSCKDEPVVEPDKWALPPLTTEGANTLGCLINGEPFVADRQPIPYMGGDQWNMHAYYIDSFQFEIYGKDVDRQNNSLKLVLQTNRPLTLLKSESYILYDSTSYPETKYLDFSNFGGRPYRVIESEPQWVKVSSFKEKGHVAGTFQFTGVSMEGDTVRITDGRFDIALD